MEELKVDPEYKYKIKLEAEIVPRKATVASRKEAASVLGLPPEEERQPDLTYFTSIFVSSGVNLNRAFFLPSEVVMASHSIPTKAVDIEHKEDQVIGHIYKHTFLDSEYKECPYDTLASMPTDQLDGTPIHVEIASVVYKDRFPEISKQIEDKKWKVSMEAYYKDFDIKVGDLLFSKNEAKALGLDVDQDATFFNTIVKVVEQGAVLVEDYPAKVLRGIHFSGVGIVENPANPPSVILETSSDTKTIIFDKEKISRNTNNNVTTVNIEGNNIEVTDSCKESSELVYKDTVGICVNYKKEYLSDSPKDQDTKVLHTDWCTAFDTQCTSFGHDATDPSCLRNQAKVVAGVLASVYEPPVTKKRLKLNKLIEKINKLYKK